jgi:HTH-type transcriptional regulator, sugar sensing transcriptional regulator
MAEDFQLELQELGLLPAEAQVYLALVRNGALGGSAIASVTGFPRSSVYLTLNSLLDKGLIEGGAGHGSRFSVVPPDKALPSLVVHEKEAIAQREKTATQLGQKLLSSLEELTEPVSEELIQVIRSPRAVIERYERLQSEVERQFDVFTKPPFFVAPANNPIGERALRRGVRSRSLYEKGALDDPNIGPSLGRWIAAGEEARVYDGELPHKLAIFDCKVVLMPLIRPGEQTKTVLIRHPQLAQTLTLAFDHLWEKSKPLTATSHFGVTLTQKVSRRRRNQRLSHNSTSSEGRVRSAS